MAVVGVRWATSVSDLASNFVRGRALYLYTHDRCHSAHSARRIRGRQDGQPRIGTANRASASFTPSFRPRPMVGKINMYTSFY